LHLRAYRHAPHIAQTCFFAAPEPIFPYEKALAKAAGAEMGYKFSRLLIFEAENRQKPIMN
jgi:hypothetical protein